MRLGSLSIVIGEEASKDLLPLIRKLLELEIEHQKLMNENLKKDFGK